MLEPRCPKCDVRMEEGFILDNSQAARFQAAWVEGKPQKSFWTGVKIREEAKHPIATFRCERCGFLESYAAAT